MLGLGLQKLISDDEHSISEQVQSSDLPEQ